MGCDCDVEVDCDVDVDCDVGDLAWWLAGDDCGLGVCCDLGGTVCIFSVAAVCSGAQECSGRCFPITTEK